MQLVVRSGPDAGSSVEVDRRITIGREGEFRLTDPAVSRSHAAATPTSDGHVLLEDTGSSTGTVVNGTRLFGPVTLRGGEQIVMGGTTLEAVAIQASVAAPPPASGAQLPPAPVIPPPPEPAPVPSSTPADRRKTLAIALIVAGVVALGVVAFLVFSGDDEPSVPVSPTTGTTGGQGETGADGPTVSTTAPLAGLNATPGAFSSDPGTWIVSLSWAEAPEALGLDHYEVMRNGKRIAAAVTETTFVDEGVFPGDALDYEVIAVGSGGRTEPAVVAVSVAELPLSEALVDGRWLVEMRVTKTNLDDVGSTATMRWEFDPSCDFGSCDVLWSVVGKGVGAFLIADGTRYEGVGSGPFLIRSCFDEPVDEELTLRFTVKRAGVKAGVLAATSMRGTIREVARTPGCITATRTFSFTATRV